MKVRIKKLSESAKIPSYSKSGDAGMDLVAITRELYTKNLDSADFIEYGTGISIEIPEGYMGLIFPRSSNSKKHLTLTNSIGLIDSGYRGEIKIRYKVDGTYDTVYLTEDLAICEDITSTFSQHIYDIGDKVAQLVILPYPQIELEEVEELSSTERGEGAFGSTGS